MDSKWKKYKKKNKYCIVTKEDFKIECIKLLMKINNRIKR